MLADLWFKMILMVDVDGRHDEVLYDRHPVHTMLAKHPCWHRSLSISICMILAYSMTNILGTCSIVLRERITCSKQASIMQVIAPIRC